MPVTSQIEIVRVDVAPGGALEQDQSGLWVFPTIIQLRDGQHIDFLWCSHDQLQAREDFAGMPREVAPGLMSYEPSTGDVMTRLF